MHKTTVYLDEELHRTLQRLADASGRTQAQIIREALQVYARGEQRRPRSIGMGRGEPS
jgi:predicted transcriptional regulator